MQKKTMWAVLCTLLAVMVASISLVLAVGPKSSALTEENRILTLSDWGDFHISYSTYLYGLSESFYSSYMGYSNMGCGDFGGHSDKIDDYDEIHILIPEGITTIDYEAFYHAPSEFRAKLTYVSIPNSVNTIYGQAFRGCTGLTSIVIPGRVTSMHYNVFDGCVNLETIYCEAEAQPDDWNEGWKSACDANVVWGYKAQNTVTFEANGGSAVDSQVVDYGNQATAPTSSKDGYTLVGWYTEDTLENEYDFTSAVTKDITLYAKWELKTYTVTFDSNSGSAVMAQTNIEHGSTATKPADPTKEGCTFAGWYTDAALTNAYDFDSAVTSDLTLYAKWEVIPEPEPEPETPVDNTDNTVDEENSVVVNADKNNMTGVVAGVSVGAAVLIVAGVTVGVVLAKKRRK